MKLATTLLAVSLALVWSSDTFAASRKREKRDRSAETYSSQGTRSRSNTVAANGLCQRDTGTHNSNLNFRNKCDTEEFWARQGRGGGRR